MELHLNSGGHRVSFVFETFWFKNEVHLNSDGAPSELQMELHLNSDGAKSEFRWDPNLNSDGTQI